MINFLIKEFEHNNTNEQLIKSVDQLSAIVDNYKKEYWKRTKIPIADDTLNLLIKYFENPNTINNPTKKLKF
jgi:wyosine [tRNA(Phe)-imidazoG37] synthetase (radical SAM superfamily)